MRLRQVALVARDLEPAVRAVRDVLGVDVAYRDPGVAVFGLVNAVMPVGDTFLEVVSPAKPGTTAERFLERRGGDGGYMVILQTTDLAAARQRVQAQDVRIAWETALEDAATIHLHPSDVGGAILSLDAMDPPDSWRWAGPDWRNRVRTETTEAITAVEIQDADPAARAARWSQILGCPARACGDGRHEIALEESALRFVPASDGRGPGVCGLEVRARDPEKIRVLARDQGLPVADDGSVALCGIRLLVP